MKIKRGELYIIFSAAGFGLMPILAKFAYKTGANVNQVLLYRFIAASVMLWIYVLATRRDVKIGISNIAYLGVLGVLGYDSTAVLTFTAFKYISAGLADLLLFLYPPLIVALRYVLYKEKISKSGFTAMVLSISGIILIVWTPNGNYNIVGVITGVLSAVTYSFYVISLGAKRLHKIDGVVITTYITTFCTFGMLAYSSITRDAISLPGLNGFLFIILISIISTVMPILLFCLGVKEIGSSNASIISTIEPAVATFAGVAFLGETISIFTICGGALIISGVVLLQNRSNAKSVIS